MSRIAILGTGLLGAGFAENLLSQGHTVVVWNRTASKTAPLVEKGAVAADTPADAVEGADRAHLVLTSDDAVESVIEQLRTGLSAETWIIDHSTNAPERVADRFQSLRAQGVRYLHAPVFMSPANAKAGTGLMLLAGPDDEAATLTPYLEQMTGMVWLVGERPELAAIHKLCGNGALVAVAGLMGDLYAIGESQGLTSAQVDELFDVFKLGGVFPRVGQRVKDAPGMETSFALSMARKDVRLMLEAAGERDDLVVLPGVAQRMDTAIEAGEGDKDFAVMAWRGRKEG